MLNCKGRHVGYILEALVCIGMVNGVLKLTLFSSCVHLFLGQQTLHGCTFTSDSLVDSRLELVKCFVSISQRLIAFDEVVRTQ